MVGAATLARAAYGAIFPRSDAACAVYNVVQKSSRGMSAITRSYVVRVQIYVPTLGTESKRT